ncbi:MAG: tRNA (guanine37-N1)-methyltransferase [Frankiaceae bacterium]|nr:tRNA (guanine37-N1)-methyltransferase [Frankiaceae bacterium]
MRIDVVTIFPDYVAGPLGLSLIGKARERGLLDLRIHDLRAWTDDVHHTVDDAPYGGGPGMVMKPEPWGAALDAIVGEAPEPPVLVVPTPSGLPFTQRCAARLSREPWIAFACGRYEGIDSRVLEDARSRMRVEELSLGDYVLAGGEVAALVVIEAVTRLLPGVVGNEVSLVDDSFADGSMSSLLEGPVYTRPPSWRGLGVPDVLSSGDHGAIARWRMEQALRRTAERRPELLPAIDPASLDKKLRPLLAELLEQSGGRFPLPGTDVAE